MLIEGNNTAENHPMGMKWVLAAKAAGAPVIVVDPKFNRTAAHADLYVRIRPGSDIAFQAALVNVVLAEGLFDREFLVRATNASFLVREDFAFDEGLFSGYDAAKHAYDPASWAYRVDGSGRPLTAGLEEPGTVLGHLKAHFARYTPEVAERISGVPAAQIRQVARTFASRRPGVVMYALGATQHSYGVQQIRCYAILQLLLGNMGRAGGGVAANRGESNVQGATDMCVAWDKLPGYLETPRLDAPTLHAYRATFGTAMHARLVNLLCAWFGDAARARADFGYGWLPQRDPRQDLSLYAQQRRMREGAMRFLMVMGENPAVSQANQRLMLEALAKLEMLVVVDIFPSETAQFFSAFALKPEDVGTEVIALPAAAFLEKDGCLTNSGRWVQGREVAVPPPGEAKADLWILDQLFRRVRALIEADAAAPGREAVIHAAWDYGDPIESREVLLEIGGSWTDSGAPLPGSAALRADGTTACGNALYAGIGCAPDGTHRDRSQDRDLADPSGLGLHPGFAWAWPDNTRILYNRGSAGPDGRPLDADRPLVWWDAAAAAWQGHTTPHVADARAAPGSAADAVFPRLALGRGRLFVGPEAMRVDGALVSSSPVLKDGPLPEHYEPIEGLVPNLLHPAVGTNPVVCYPHFPDQKPLGDAARFPHLLCTGFLHEMWGGGAMTRRMTRLVELQPEPFVEISRELAAREVIRSGDQVVIETARGSVTLKAMVTPRLRPVVVAGATVEIVWAPMHYGPLGLARGGVLNAVTLDALEPNVGIQETKACLCRVRRAPTRKVDGS